MWIKFVQSTFKDNIGIAKVYEVVFYNVRRWGWSVFHRFLGQFIILLEEIFSSGDNCFDVG